MKLGHATTTFRSSDFFPERPNVGYETLFYDCMQGDATLFQRADNIDASWAAMEPALTSWAETKCAPAPYAAGSSGPAAADELLAGSGRHWAPLGSD